MLKFQIISCSCLVMISIIFLTFNDSIELLIIDFLFSLSKLALALAFALLEVFSAEYYQTKERAVAIGMLHGASRVAGMLVAPINEIMLFFGITFPFFVMTILTFISVKILQKLGDTTGKPIN